ncbi:GNAT family N-acetyltransferase [Ktedonosporobacter rubrisoli]|uniref:GNAT family N-acetyltransferase n=1 Tax=Ktedonosporobacter rubrisoli TaxID=2509675 RepID=A0A4P6JUL5_KTERU|nr:GNAT family N-acetyltransferase [Ktedonosporobacter rubrisoli]QBD78992.1 GNAT family N-acetyltransferase [Ktedonosporobacter rubrisoli]
MTFATWWRGDPLPDLAPLPTFSAHLSSDIHLISQVTNRPLEAITPRLQEGNRPYLAFMGEAPVAYGWVATQEGSISDLGMYFALPAGNCYLHSFRTLPAWRGQGIYPRLLQTIIQQEQSFERFWIGYMPSNIASGRGIQKAGFHVVSDLAFVKGRVCGITLFEKSERALASAAVFQLPVVSTT